MTNTEKFYVETYSGRPIGSGVMNYAQFLEALQNQGTADIIFQVFDTEDEAYEFINQF